MWDTWLPVAEIYLHIAGFGVVGSVPGSPFMVKLMAAAHSPQGMRGPVLFVYFGFPEFLFLGLLSLLVAKKLHL
jgi:hypothetical protein